MNVRKINDALQADEINAAVDKLKAARAALKAELPEKKADLHELKAEFLKLKAEVIRLNDQALMAKWAPTKDDTDEQVRKPARIKRAKAPVKKDEMDTPVTRKRKI